MSEVFFFIAAIGAVGGAVGTVVLRDPFYSVLSLVFHLLSLAALFLLLRAEFVAASQVIVYAGAVMVLYVFVVAYVGGGEQSLAAPAGGTAKALAGVFAVALFAELAIAVLGSGLKAIDSEGAPYRPGFGTPAEIGTLFLTKFLIAFEIASLLLLVAAVGAVILARRRSERRDATELSVGELMRGDGEGPGGPITAGDARPETMIESGGPAQR